MPTYQSVLAIDCTSTLYVHLGSVESAQAWQNHFCSWSFDPDLAHQNHSVIKAWKEVELVGEKKKKSENNLTQTAFVHRKGWLLYSKQPMGCHESAIKKRKDA